MDTANALLGITVEIPIRLARSLYARWRSLAPAERERLAPLAAEAKERALDLRGVTDRERADRELRAANESLAAGIVESAAADPEVTECELRRLREDLRRELGRLPDGHTGAASAEGAPGEPRAADRR